MNPDDEERSQEDFIQRVDARLKRIEEIGERSEQEFELNREIQVEVLRRMKEDHIEVLREVELSRNDATRRSEDLSEHMREQTQALMRINERLGP